MKLQDVLGGMFALILIFLILNRSSDTAKVISSLSGAVTNNVAVLQGRTGGTSVADASTTVNSNPILTLLSGLSPQRSIA